MNDLAHKRCVPCEGGTLPLQKEEAEILLRKLNKEWMLKDGKLTRSFDFHDFKQAMEFVNAVAKIAQEEYHHPDIFIYFNKVKLELFTHSIKGLSENDFILAAKIDKLGSS